MYVAHPTLFAAACFSCQILHMHMHTDKYLFNLQLNLAFGILGRFSNKLYKLSPLNLVNHLSFYEIYLSSDIWTFFTQTKICDNH